MLDAAKALSTCPIQPQAVRVSHFQGRRPITTAIRIWPAPAAWAQGLASDDRWFPVPFAAAGAVLADPDEPHVDSRLLDGWDVDLRASLAKIPDEVRDAIRLVPRVYAWRVLRVTSLASAAIDLANEHPVLLGLLAFDPRTLYADKPFHEHTLREEFRDALDQPRCRLLGLLGLPADPRLVAFLAAMQPEALRNLGDDGVMELLQEQSRRWL